MSNLQAGLLLSPTGVLFKSRNKDRKGTFYLVGAEVWIPCWPVLLSDISSPCRKYGFRVHFGSQVVLPPHRRWDLCQGQLHQFWRKRLREQFICPKGWRCSAQEFLVEMSNSLRWFEGRVSRALSTRLPLSELQCSLCQCHGELQPMRLDFLFGQVKVCK